MIKTQYEVVYNQADSSYKVVRSLCGITSDLVVVLGNWRWIFIDLYWHRIWRQYFNIVHIYID